MNRLRSGLLGLVYRLENHQLLEISLYHWLWALVLAPPLLAVLRRMGWTSAIPLSLLGIVLIVTCAWVRRGGYVVWEARSWGTEPGEAPAGPPVRVDEQIPCWASGLFEVSGRRKSLLAEEAYYSFVRTREHIVAARVKRTRFLLLASSVRADTGWWYVFWMPGQVNEVREGYQVHPFRQRPALYIRSRCPVEGKPDQSQEVYLAFADETMGRRVVADLRLDVPPDAFQD